MKAIVLKNYGGIDQLELRDVPDPTPAAGEVVGAIAAPSVNPIDYKLRSGSARGRIPLELPAILGRDIAGEVLALASDVARFRGAASAGARRRRGGRLAAGSDHGCAAGRARRS